MVTWTSPFLASPTVVLSFGGHRSSAVRSFKQCELENLSLGFKTSGLCGSRFFRSAVERVVVVGKTVALLLFQFRVCLCQCQYPGKFIELRDLHGDCLSFFEN